MIRASGLHRGQPVGFEVLLGSNWRGGSSDKELPLVIYQGTVTYRSLGAESDAFVQVLDDLYGTRAGVRTMAVETRFTGLSLEGNPGKLAEGPVKIKLFYESGDEKDYVEFFTNVELGKRRIEFREKDPEYRPAIIRALKPH